MNEHENIRAALDALASSPKVASTVAAATAGMGFASIMSQIQTVLGLISLIIGCVVGLYVLRIHAIKHKIYQRMWDNNESLKE
jgi:hypothetical protein